jgi:hypothetical protein
LFQPTYSIANPIANSWALFDGYCEDSLEGRLLLAARSSSERDYDLGTANGVIMLRDFCKVCDLSSAAGWIDSYGFPWSADRVHLDEFGLEYGVLLEDVIERAQSMRLLLRLTSIVRGNTKSKTYYKNVLAWPVADSPLAGGGNLLDQKTWRDLAPALILCGRENAKEYYFGRLRTHQELAVAFVPKVSSWCGRLMPPLLEALEPVERSFCSRVDFRPVFVSSEFGHSGFEAVVNYAAASVLLEVLPRLIRGVFPSLAPGAVVDGRINLTSRQFFPSPLALMAYEIYKKLMPAQIRRATIY